MLNNLASITLSFIIFFAPFAFGVIHLWSETILDISALSLLFLYLLGSVGRGRIEYKKTTLNYLFVFLISCIIFQLLFRTTKYPYYTYLGIKRIAIYFALFTAVVNLSGKGDEPGRVLFKIILAGFFISVLGILQLITGTDKIFWVKEFPRRCVTFGPFTLTNFFACYISMAALLALGRLAAAMYEGEPISWDIPLKHIFLKALDKLFDRKFLFIALCLAVMVTALFLSRCRGGILFFLVSAILFASSLFSVKYPRKALWIIISSAIMIYLLLKWIGLTAVLRELNTIFSPDTYGGRLDVYIDALKMLKKSPLTGIGFLAFSNVFPLYRSGPVLNFYRFLHSDILQFLIEVGIPCFVIITTIFLVFAARLIRRAQKAQNPHRYCIVLSLISVFFYLGLHASIDFGMRSGAVSSLFVIILAVASVIADAGRPPGVLRINAGKRPFVYTAISILFVWFFFVLLKPLIAHIITENGPTRARFNAALRLDPDNDGLYFKNYGFVTSEFRKGSLSYEETYVMAKRLVDRALELNPYKTVYLLAEGDLELWHKNYEAAMPFFRKASLAEPYTPLVQMSYACSLFWRGLDETDVAKRANLLKKGFIYYSTAVYLDRHANIGSVIRDEEASRFIREALKNEGLAVN